MFRRNTCRVIIKFLSAVLSLKKLNVDESVIIIIIIIFISIKLITSRD